MARVNPYLNYPGNAEEAFNFYKSIFGGEFSAFSRFGEVKEMAGQVKDPGKILHIALPISRETILMGCDYADTMGPIKAGNNFSVCIQTDSREEADRVFNKLSEGGKTDMQMTKTFWGSYFGMCFDKFGIRWMIDYSEAETEAKAEQEDLERSGL